MFCQRVISNRKRLLDVRTLAQIKRGEFMTNSLRSSACVTCTVNLKELLQAVKEEIRMKLVLRISETLVSWLTLTLVRRPLLNECSIMLASQGEWEVH